MQSLYTEILQTAEEKLESRRKSNELKTELRLRTQNTTDDIDTRPDILPQVSLDVFRGNNLKLVNSPKFVNFPKCIVFPETYCVV